MSHLNAPRPQARAHRCAFRGDRNEPIRFSTVRRLVRSFLSPMAAAFAVVAAAAFVMPTTPAQAESELVVRYKFLGWSGVNADAFLVHAIDPARTDRLEVRQVGNPAPNVSVNVNKDTYATAIASPQIAQWSFVIPGHPGLQAPNKWKVFGQQEGALVRIGVTNGKSSVQIGVVQAKTDNGGRPSKSTLRTAYWSADSKRVVVVVNHKTTGAWSLDMDEVHAFKIGE